MGPAAGSPLLALSCGHCGWSGDRAVLVGGLPDGDHELTGPNWYVCPQSGHRIEIPAGVYRIQDGRAVLLHRIGSTDSRREPEPTPGEKLASRIGEDLAATYAVDKIRTWVGRMVREHRARKDPPPADPPAPAPEPPKKRTKRSRRRQQGRRH